MDRETRFHELDDFVESLTIDEQNFVMWLLLRRYAERLDMPEQCNTIEDYRKERVNHTLWVNCKELISMLDFELWR